MKQETFIKIDSELGKRLNLTSDRFTNSTIWDIRPKGLYVTQLLAREPKEDNLRAFFQAADKIATPVYIVAQPELTTKIAEEFGYACSVDQTGTPSWDNTASKFLKNL